MLTSPTGLSYLAAPEMTQVSELTRRGLFGGVLATGLLAACGTEPKSATTETGDGFPRIVKHAEGSVEIPARPERVFVEDSTQMLDCLLALGVAPAVIGGARDELSPWSAAAGAGDATFVTQYSPEVEIIAAEQVDLSMLTKSTWDQEGLSAPIRQLAPTLVEPDPYSVPTILALLGEALGLEDRARDVADEYEAEIGSFEVDNPPASVAVFVPTEDGPYVYPPSDTFVGAFFASLGLTLADVGTEDVLSLERLDRLDADLVLALDNYAPNSVYLDELEKSAVFQAVPAVADGRYRRLGVEDSQAVLFPSPLCLTQALDALRAVL